jgi:hypothetical protein
MVTELPAICDNCKVPIGKLNSNGVVEKHALLPCGHIFGNECIKKWMGLDAAGQPSEARNRPDARSCPLCRRKLVYPYCGHTILPKELPLLVKGDRSGEARPLPVQIIGNEKDTPPQCFQCMLQDLPLHWDYAMLEKGAHLLENLCSWTGTQCLPEEVRGGHEITISILTDWKWKLTVEWRQVEGERREYAKLRGPEKW